MTHLKATNLSEFSRLVAKSRALNSADDTWDGRCAEYVQFGSRLTDEEREWQRTKLLPAVIESLRRAADDVNAAAGTSVR